jgi:hypothetical protein
MPKEFPRENNTGYDIEKEGQLNKYIKCNSSIAYNPATVLTSDHVEASPAYRGLQMARYLSVYFFCWK